MKKSGLKFFVLGLVAFLTLGMDLFVIPIDILIFKDTFDMNNFFNGPWYTLIVHWSIVVTMWIIGILLLFRHLKKKDIQHEVVSTSYGRELIPLIIIAVIAGIIFTIIDSLIFNTSIPQFYREYKSFSLHNDMAIIVSIFQNIYYIVESALVVLLLALMQRAGELWFKNKNIPYGGIGLAFTWGIVHFMHGLSSGLWITCFSFVLGYLFLKANKRWWPSLIFVWLMFFI